MGTILLSEAIDRFTTWATTNNAAATVNLYRHYLRRFLAAVGDMPLTDLTPAMVTRWSVKFHPVQAVQRLTSWCHRFDRSIDDNPLRGLSKPRMGQRRRVLERREMLRLLRSATPCFRRFLILCRESMCRPQEARALTWGDVAGESGRGLANPQADDAPAHFELPTAKGFERRRDASGARVIPISPRLSRLLGRLARDGVTLGMPILLDARGRRWSGNAVRCRMRRLRIRAGLAADRRGERVVTYTLRHTGATAAVASGVRDFMLAEILGHASTRTTARYVHLRPADLCKALESLWEVKTADRPKNDRLGSLRTRPDGQR